MDSRTVKSLIDNFEQKPDALVDFIKSYPFWIDTYWEVQSRYKDEHSRPETRYGASGHDDTTSVTIDHEATLLGNALYQNKPDAALLLIPKTNDFLKGYKTFENHQSSTHGPMGGITDNNKTIDLSETSAVAMIDASNNETLISALFKRLIQLNLFKNNPYLAFMKKHFAKQQTLLSEDCNEAELSAYLQTQHAAMNPQPESKPITTQTVTPPRIPKPKRPLTQEEKSSPQTESDTFNVVQSANRVEALKNKYLKLSSASKKNYKHFTPLKNSFAPTGTLFNPVITADTIQALAKNIKGGERVFAFEKENTAENREKIADYLNSNRSHSSPR